MSILDRINPSGLVVAGIGFFLTRFTVTLALYEDPMRFYFAGILPLVLGLGLSAFGVALTVADVDGRLVRTTAIWCVVGTVAMLVLVVLTYVASTDEGMLAFGTARSRAYFSNFLIGGSVGGTITGLYSARNRQQRGRLRQQTNRLEVLNRLLRHEILNALTAIRGYADLLAEGRTDADVEARSVIETRSDDIERTIEEVKYLTEQTDEGDVATGPTDLVACVTDSVDRVRDAFPDASITVSSEVDEVTVRANDRLGLVVTHLLENAAGHTSAEPDVAVHVSVTETHASVTVRDDGPGLPESQRRLLETGDIGRFDEPESGFGLNIVRLLVESFRGSIETTVDDGTAITVTLPRADATGLGIRPAPDRLPGFQPNHSHLLVTFVAALVAGVVYGAVTELVGESIAGIGVFYGTASPVIGWLTHEFHSVVFGFVFAGILSLSPRRYRDSLPAHVLLGLGWALVLWTVAAGLIAPVWLRLLGIPATIPNVDGVILLSHLAWGASLGVLTAAGYDRVVPRLRGVLG